MDRVWRRKSAMNCVRWSMGDAALHGIGTSSVPASLSGVTHVPGLNCYLCPRTVPTWRLTLPSSGQAAAQPERLAVTCKTENATHRLLVRLHQRKGWKMTQHHAVKVTFSPQQLEHLWAE